MDKSIEGNTTMQKDNVIELKKPETVTDLLTEVLRNGAQQLLTAATTSRVKPLWKLKEFLNKHNKGEGAARFRQNGYATSKREIQTAGGGGIAVAVPRVRRSRLSQLTIYSLVHQSFLFTYAEAAA